MELNKNEDDDSDKDVAMQSNDDSKTTAPASSSSDPMKVDTPPTTAVASSSTTLKKKSKPPKIYACDDKEIDPRIFEAWSKFSWRHKWKHKAATTKRLDDDDNKVEKQKRKQELKDFWGREYSRITLAQPWKNKSMDGTAHEIDIERDWDIWKAYDLSKVLSPSLEQLSVPTSYRNDYDRCQEIGALLTNIVKTLGYPLYVQRARSQFSTAYDCFIVRSKEGTTRELEFVVECIPTNDTACFESKSAAVNIFDNMAWINSHARFGCVVAPGNRIVIASTNVDENRSVYMEAFNTAFEELMNMPVSTQEESKTAAKPSDTAKQPAKEDVYYTSLSSPSDDQATDETTFSVAGQKHRRKIAYSPIYEGSQQMIRALTFAIVCSHLAPKTRFLPNTRDGEDLYGIFTTVTPHGWSWTPIQEPLSLRFNCGVDSTISEQLYIIGVMGFGLSATAYWACDVRGRCFCLKMYLLSQEPAEAASLEVKRWRTVYPWSQSLCQQLTLLDGKVCTIVPLVVHISQEDYETMTDEINAEVTRIKEVGLVFRDEIVDRRSVGCVVAPDGSKVIVLTNLRSLVEIETSTSSSIPHETLSLPETSHSSSIPDEDSHISPSLVAASDTEMGKQGLAS